MRQRYIFILLFTITCIFFLSCNNGDKRKTTITTSDTSAEPAIDNQHTTQEVGGRLQAPEFANKDVRDFYAAYTNYMKNVVAAIREKDERKAFKLFTDEGPRFGNQTEMEEKAKAEDESKFNTWLLESMPYQKEIVQSEYFKKYREEYRKKVKDEFEKKY